MREAQPRICCQCELPLIELGAHGERLCRCVGCNNWQSLDSGEWCHLPDDDIAALSDMVTRWTKEAERIGVEGWYLCGLGAGWQRDSQAQGEATIASGRPI
jgi:hypothetical protein